MEMVLTAQSTRRAKLQSNCYRQETNIQLSTGWIPLRSPNQQCLSTEGITFDTLISAYTGCPGIQAIKRGCVLRVSDSDVLSVSFLY